MSHEPDIRSARSSELEDLLPLRHGLWPTTTLEEHRLDLESYFAGHAREPLEILVAEEPEGRLVGFCELSVRAYAEDCHTDQVGYLEGWYVVPERRGQGVGRALVLASEAWARARGCSEFASDAEADNAGSIAAHKALGFEDVGLIRCFRKDL